MLIVNFLKFLVAFLSWKKMAKSAFMMNYSLQKLKYNIITKL